MPELTKEKLGEFIRDTTVPLVKDIVGKEVAERVEESIKTAFDEQKKNQESVFEQWGIKSLFQKQGSGVIQTPKKEEPGIQAARMVRCLVAGKGDPEKAGHFANKWGFQDLANIFESRKEKAMASGDPELGGFWIEENFSNELIDELKPRVVIRSLNPSPVPMPDGQFSEAKITQGATASYVGENQNAPKSEVQTGLFKLVAKKLVTLVPVSNDLIKSRSASADSRIRDNMVRDMGVREDRAFLRDQGTDATPKGLLHWAPSDNKISANGTVNLANVTADLGRLLLVLMNKDVPMTRPAWIMAPRSFIYLTTVQDGNGNFPYRPEMIQNGTLWGWPFRWTTQIPITLGAGSSSELYMVDMDDAVLGDTDGINIDASGDAAYYDGAQLQAAFSRDQTVIRAITRHDFGMKRPESVGVLDTVNWIP